MWKWDQTKTDFKPMSSKFIDRTGIKYGRLTAQYPVLGRGTNNKRLTYWSCDCECGTTDHRVIGDSLTRGQVLSCGCILGTPGKAHPNARWVGELSLGHLSTIKNQARSRQIPFEVSDQYLADLFEQQDFKCALTDLPLVSSNLPKTRTASLDRIDSKKGYIEGNLQWVNKYVNRMKNSYDQDLYIELCQLVAAKATRD
jgi:hypothetical protein